MQYGKSILSKSANGVRYIATAVLALVITNNVHPEPMFAPVVNGEALRGLSTIGSAESMGEGRITFNVIGSWYQQEKAYLNTPNVNAQIFVGKAAFSYGVNSQVDIFASIAGFGSSDYTSSSNNSGLGTIKAGVQGSLPFPQYAFMRMGGQAAILGGTSSNQINTYRADGYNHFDTRTDYAFLGKLMQTAQAGLEDFGVKFHLNEAGVFNISNNKPALLLLGAGVQANVGILALGAELNSRTQFNNMTFGTDPVWFTPSLHFRTPYSTNAMFGVDISLSEDRLSPDPRALEPFRVFGAVAFSFDMLAKKRAADAQQEANEDRAAQNLEYKAYKSEQKVQSLTEQSARDSATLASEISSNNAMQDSMQQSAQNRQRTADSLAGKADSLAGKASADALLLQTTQAKLAEEKSKRSDAENMLLSTGELLLDAVYFKTGKTEISINSKSYLNVIGKMLLKYPKLQYEVAGYTDNVGSQSSNVTLSQGRADAVRIYLAGIAPGLNVTARGYGMDMPKADNSTSEGRLVNRRVELRVLNKDALQEYTGN